MTVLLYFTESQHKWLSSSFSPATFKCLGTKGIKSKQDKSTNERSKQTSASSEYPLAEEIQISGVYTCPQDGCVRVFQRLHALDNHLSIGQCTKSLEKYSLFDLAKIRYKSALEEGVGVIPVLNPVLTTVAMPENRCKEGWALRTTKKSYRFNDKQKAYLNAKFEIGQATGRKQDVDMVAREMRRAQVTDGRRLFGVSEFLTPQQIASYFSRMAAKVRHQAADDQDIQANEEEANFAKAREIIMSSIQLQHPIMYEQYNVCIMAKENTLKHLKLAELQNICEALELEVPHRPIRRKAPYIALLLEVLNQCSCQCA